MMADIRFVFLFFVMEVAGSDRGSVSCVGSDALTSSLSQKICNKTKGY